MVLVLIDTLQYNDNMFISDMTVVGENLEPILESPYKIMDFITRIFKEMEFNYWGNHWLGKEIFAIGAAISELARSKCRIAAVPLNNYGYCSDGIIGEGRLVFIFIDECAPFRKIYLMTRDNNTWSVDININGIYAWSNVRESIDVYFIKPDKRWSAAYGMYDGICRDHGDWCRDDEVHILPMPGADSVTHKLLQTIMDLHRGKVARK